MAYLGPKNGKVSGVKRIRQRVAGKADRKLRKGWVT